MSTLIVADDHPLFRAALKDVIKQVAPDHALCEAASFAELQQLVEQQPTALVLLDLAMPGAHGFSALIYLSSHHPGVPVLMISASDQENIVRRAADHGAAGFVSKSASMEAIGAAIAAVLAGELCFPAGIDLSEAWVGDEENAVASALASLTPQQFRVATMIGQGLLNKQIAWEMGVTEATVKAHVTEVFRKLGVHSRTQAALKLGQLNLAEDADGAPSAS